MRQSVAFSTDVTAKFCIRATRCVLTAMIGKLEINLAWEGSLRATAEGTSAKETTPATSFPLL